MAEKMLDKLSFEKESDLLVYQPSKNAMRVEQIETAIHDTFIIGLVTNCETIYCRIEERIKGYNRLSDIRPHSGYFFLDQRKDSPYKDYRLPTPNADWYKKTFPVVARGFCAFVLANVGYNDRVKMLAYRGEIKSKEDLFRQYRKMCADRYYYKHQEEYRDYHECNAQDKINELDKAFVKECKKADSKPIIYEDKIGGLISAEFIKAIKELHKEYLIYIGAKKQNETTPKQPIVYDKYNNGLIFLFVSAFIKANSSEVDELKAKMGAVKTMKEIAELSAVLYQHKTYLKQTIKGSFAQIYQELCKYYGVTPSKRYDAPKKVDGIWNGNELLPEIENKYLPDSMIKNPFI